MLRTIAQRHTASICRARPSRPLFDALPNIYSRGVATLQNNPHIYVHPDKTAPVPSHILSLLPDEPASPDLAIGTTTKVPPTPESFRGNPKFLQILDSVLHEHAHADPQAISQAYAFASTAGSASIFMSQQVKGRSSGAGGANLQGGAGGGGVGGWIHLSDTRNPPDYGRIAWPEDIFGSLEVDGQGNFVGDKGNYQSSGTYRIVTRDGILGLSDYLRSKLVERLKQESK